MCHHGLVNGQHEPIELVSHKCTMQECLRANLPASNKGRTRHKPNPARSHIEQFSCHSVWSKVVYIRAWTIGDHDAGATHRIREVFRPRHALVTQMFRTGLSDLEPKGLSNPTTSANVSVRTDEEEAELGQISVT